MTSIFTFRWVGDLIKVRNGGGAFMVEVVKINDDFSWIKVENLTDSDRNELQSNYQIPKRFLRYVSDVHERARFDTDEDSNATLVIFDVVVSQHFDGMDNTEPVAFLITPDTFISFTRPKSSFINHSIKELIDHHLTKKKNQSAPFSF